MKKILPLLSFYIAAVEIAQAAPPATSDTTIHQLSDRRVIIERVPEIILPDPPQPVARPVPDAEAVARMANRIADWQAQRVLRPSIHAGATVYRLPDGKYVTHVTNWSVNNGTRVSFWSSADFSVLAHLGSFTHATLQDEAHYTMLLLCGTHDIALRANFAAARGRDYQPPSLPEFPEGAATWMLDERQAAQKLDVSSYDSITHLHAHYNQHLAEIQNTYAQLQATRAAQRAELEANPPQPRDIHLRVSRLSPAQAAAWHQHAIEQKGVRP